MRWPQVILVLGLLHRPAWADEMRYASAGDPYEFATVAAPVPAAALGSMVEGASRGREAKDDDAAKREQAAAAVPTLSWRGPGRPGEPAAMERVAALHARKRFRVGPEATRLKVLRLRVRYQDALLVSLNGVEVARRYLDPAAAPLASSPRSRAGEWEAIPIALAPGQLKKGDNVISFEVRPAASRRAPTLDFELLAGDQTQVARGPLVQRVGRTSATVVFETDLPTRAEVRYGSRADALQSRAGAGKAATPATRHVVTLTGLAPGSRVFYRLVLEGTPLEVRSFGTAPNPGEPVRFAVFGDVRTGHDVHARIAQALGNEAPDFVLSTGDAVMAAHDEGDWQRYFSVAKDLLATVPLYPACGNHDMGATAAAQRTFEDIFALWPAPSGRPATGSWYSFDVGDLHFVMLDSNRYNEPAQLAWLDADLAAARKAGTRGVFATTHHGPWSRGPHGGSAQALAEYVPVLQKHGVAMLFAGHDHIYQRGQVGRLRYVVSGGGGAPLYPLRCGGHGRPACEPDGAETAVSEHHYLLVEVYRDRARLCPRRPDGTPLEECLSFPLR